MAFEPDITILQVIQEIQSHFIEDEEAAVVYEMMLAGMLDLTESEYGFIAEVFYSPEGAPYLRTLATTNIAWDEETRALYERSAATGLEFHNLKTLFGAVVTSGETVIANDAPNDPRRGGLPPGHPEMNSFLGMPLYARGKLTGMAGVANRIGGYEGDLVKDLEPFLTTCASIIKAYAQLRRSSEAEQALLESEGRYRRLVEDQPDLICRITPEGNLTFVNRAYASFRGKELSECVGTNLFESVPEPDRAGLRAHFAALRPDKPFGGVEHRVLSCEGEARWVSWTNRAFFDSEGKTTELQSIGSDVTDRKRADEERRMLEEQVRQAQKLDSLGVLAGGIAHDFNNLLTGIMGNASLALMALPSDSGPRGNIEQVLTSSRRAADLCRQMLAYSGRGSFFTSPHDISGLVEDTVELLRVSIPRNAEVELRLDEELPRIVADDTQVRQVVMNLVTNAAEALPERDGRIEISTGTFECDRTYLNEAILGEECSEGRFVYLEVTDTGSGIDAPILERLFDPFFTTKFTGRGLGMAVVLGIVRSHSGAIQIDSERGIGTTVRVLFPASDEAAEPAAEREVQLVPQARAATVLVVDDESGIREITRAGLEQYGYTVLEATDGVEGLRIFKERAADIDVVLLDMTMPGLSGKDAMREIHLTEPEARVILMSGYNEEEVMGDLEAPERTGFLQKPYDPLTLVGAIDAAVRSPARSLEQS